MIDARDLTIVVPYRPDASRRSYIWGWVRDRYLEVARGAELVIGESSASVFSRSEAINNGLRSAREIGRPLVLVADADHVLTERWLETSLDLMAIGQKCWCVPNIHAFLERGISDAWMAMPPSTPAQLLPGFLPHDVDWWGYTGVSGLVLTTMEAMVEVRGFDERFDGWGLQDAGFAQAITSLGYERVKTSWCGHLWHPKNEAEPAGVGQEFGNWDLFRRYEKAAQNRRADHYTRQILAEPGHDNGWWNE